MITLLQLEYFRKLAATEHITQTARELYISQTALSSMIIGLEKELGVQLFDRSKRSIHLNEAGRSYLKYVNDAFSALENGRAALQDLTDARQRSISLAMGSSLVWMPMFTAFHTEYPNYSLKQFNHSTPRLEQALQTMSVDYVIAGENDLSVEGLEKQLVKVDRIYLCVSPDHPLASRETVTMDELREEKFISLTGISPWRTYCDRLFERAGFRPNIVLECDYTMRAALIKAGFGVALTSSLARAVDLLQPNKYILVDEEYALRPMYMFWNSKRFLSRAALDFKDFCIRYFEEHPNYAGTPAEQLSLGET